MITPDEPDPVRGALAELVALKDLKDAGFGAHDTDGEDDYLRRKPLAWAAARAALSEQPGPRIGLRNVADAAAAMEESQVDQPTDGHVSGIRPPMTRIGCVSPAVLERAALRARGAAAATSPAARPEPGDDLPEPWDYCYEWDGPFGTRKFSAARHNGRERDRSVPIYTADQVRAVISAERDRVALHRALAHDAQEIAFVAQAEISALRGALESIAEACEEHPMYLGNAATEDDLDAEGGDAAMITEIAHLARAALASKGEGA